MSIANIPKRAELQAVLVCPDRSLAQQFSVAASGVKALHLIADLKEYPTPAALDQKLGQSRPDAVLLEVGSDRGAALALLSHLVAAQPGLAVIVLYSSGDPEVILQCMRAGAAEFLPAPFRESDAEQAIMRLARRKEAEGRHNAGRGKLIAFVSAKGGSGSTTVACNVADMLARVSAKRVLLADFDLTSGTVAFIFKLNHNYSLLDGIQHSHQLDESLWASLVSTRNSLDILTAPERPYAPPVELYRVHECLEYARSIYECVVVDLPSISEKMSQAALNEADQIFLVADPELPTLFLARRTLSLLEDLGFAKEQVRVVVNQFRKRDDLTLADMEKIFRSPVYATFPQDHNSVRRSLTEGKPVPDNCDLGAAYRRFAERLFGGPADHKKASVMGIKALLSEN